ncbi:SHOCT domain-containing protein [Streptomyces sp. SID8379]|uniref:SHOCT domain-containing protein n=1 Tax=unclassified Streptomyces TaxID=2593676 RepID=UPI000360BB33|nr:MULTISPECIES: SHOCT domain-containing protein [unclassified Streptomyces]MYW70121.1 SHOCT domain-containing protein [Streptomyces sp. SID8379]
MPQRFGRPGLLGTMARTAVISGTASAVSGRVNRRLADRDAQRQAQAYEAPPYQTLAPAAPAPAPAAGGQDRVGQLTALADLRAQGLLTEEEFAREKARILAS